ncbi:PREDICTED: gamma-aminobutyric acid receptor subunit alpha-3-like [Priapulus caudatus]|uniref:Gamma-aminobutyric acid receptor subunit alpha-3-like n=1 Tax=Priapulus caudatus TaxID=37621 RepID=A0ABM1F642_PRICU|nr:PREDICTED: gamma-aminobutyric acid receptor subunit alpha-3-like [Priapulus caudatus]
MKLRKFPMDQQNCPLEFGSYSYNHKEVLYVWDPVKEDHPVYQSRDLSLSQFNLTAIPVRNATKPIGKGITTVLTLSQFSLDSRTDLPKGFNRAFAGQRTSLSQYREQVKIQLEEEIKERLKRDNCCMRFFKCIMSNPKYRSLIMRTARKSGVNSVSIIDRVSRILFPASFCIFNALYWRSLIRIEQADSFSSFAT